MTLISPCLILQQYVQGLFGLFEERFAATYKDFSHSFDHCPWCFPWCSLHFCWWNESSLNLHHNGIWL